MHTSRVIAMMFLTSAVFLGGCAPAPTPTLVPPTPDSKATETKIAENIFATQTASAPTPTNTSTPTLQPTATPTQTPRPTPTSTPASDTTVVFTDDFSSVCMYTSDNSDRTYGCENGEFTILNKGPNQAWWEYGNDSYDDAVIEADTHMVSGTDTMDSGVIFRVSSDGNSCYIFSIAPVNSKYGVFYYANRTWNELVPFTSSSAIKTGKETNHLKIIAQGKQMAFYANGQFLNTVVDASLSAGKVGFVLDSGDPNAKAAFDNLSISKINRPLQLPQPQATATPEYPPLPEGMGGLMVINYLGQSMWVTVANKRYDTDANGRVVIFLPPGTYSYSANWADRHYYNETVEIKLGKWFVRSFVANQ